MRVFARPRGLPKAICWGKGGGQLARRARLDGFIVLEAVLSKEGTVKNVSVLRGLGLGLDQAAVDAVTQWRYAPTLYNGEPVEVVVPVTVVFQLIQ